MSLKERLSRFRSFWIFPSLSVALILLTRNTGGAHPLSQLLWLVPVGLLLWTLLEYFFHRVLFHTHFRTPLLREIVNRSHLSHHAAPRDPNQILVISSFGVAVSLVIYPILFALTRDLFAASGVITGIWLGFLYYEAVHYRVHMSLGHSRLLQHQRRAHFYHHFSDPHACYGVTSPLWDHVFRSYRPASGG
jgi:sterol desaturase/sphingolipid hydroxylase (fatty acid hydroxylase superfamily)